MTPTETEDRNTIELLMEQNQELRAVCRVWIASSEAKEERIRLLEGRVARLRRRVVRLSQLLGVRRRATRTQRAKQAGGP